MFPFGVRFAFPGLLLPSRVGFPADDRFPFFVAEQRPAGWEQHTPLPAPEGQLSRVALV